MFLFVRFLVVESTIRLDFVEWESLPRGHVGPGELGFFNFLVRFSLESFISVLVGTRCRWDFQRVFFLWLAVESTTGLDFSWGWVLGLCFVCSGILCSPF